MIEVAITKDNDGFITQFVISGHSGYQEVGLDIICSAVSAIAYNAINAAEEVANVRAKYEIKDGYMKVWIPRDLKISKQQHQVLDIIFKTIEVGLKQIYLNYSDYVSILEEVKIHD